MQAHQRLKITKDHTIKTKEEAAVDNQSPATEARSLLCHVHPQVRHILFLLSEKCRLRKDQQFCIFIF